MVSQKEKLLGISDHKQDTLFWVSIECLLGITFLNQIQIFFSSNQRVRKEALTSSSVNGSTHLLICLYSIFSPLCSQNKTSKKIGPIISLVCLTLNTPLDLRQLQLLHIEDLSTSFHISFLVMSFFILSVPAKLDFFQVLRHLILCDP